MDCLYCIWNSKDFNDENAFDNIIYKMCVILSLFKCANTLRQKQKDRHYTWWQTGDRPLSEPKKYIYITWPRSVNSLWPSDTIWRQRSGSTLAQVMACCLMAPSHYLNQCWLINSPVTFILGQFHKRFLNYQSLKSVWKLHIQNFIQISQGSMS